MKATLMAGAATAVVLASGLTPVSRAAPADTAATLKEDARTTGHAVAHGAATVAHTVADKSRESGHTIADDTRTARDTVRDDSKKAGHTIAESARNLSRSVRDGFKRLKAGLARKPTAPEPKS